MTSFSSIAHSNLEICSPVPWSVYQELLSAGSLAEHPEVLDIGCGKGAVLAKAIQLIGGMGVGIELENSLGIQPTPEAHKLEAEGKIEFIFEDASVFFEKSNSSFDLIICIGSSHAVGGVEQAFRLARKHLKPNGKLLFGEIVWKSKPDPDFLEYLGCTEEDQMYSSELLMLAHDCGLSVQKSIACSDEDFEAYELALRRNVMNWCSQNPNDPRASEFSKRSDSWWEAREKWARRAFGFDVILAGLA
jgi:cyclopropane fatty-acyl-phospholipid synthase-like methyltransferase